MTDTTEDAVARLIRQHRIIPVECLRNDGTSCGTCGHYDDDHNSEGCCLCKCETGGVDRD